MIKKHNNLRKEMLFEDNWDFEELVKSNLKSVYNFILRLAKDRTTAEDLAQETFFKAWKNLEHYDKKRNFKTWIFTIAKNTTFDYFKKKKSLPFAYFEDIEGKSFLENVPEETLVPEKNLDFEINLRQLESALKKIPASYREVLILCYKEDFTLLEIAEILGESYNTIKSRHSRGLNKLRGLIL